MIMRGALTGSRRTAIVLALGLALAGCTGTDEPARPAHRTASSSHEAAQPDPPVQPPASSTSAGEAIRCLDGEWSFGPVQRERIVSHVSEPLLITSGVPVQQPPMHPLRHVVAEVEGNAPPELAYAQVRRLLASEPDLPPLGARPDADDAGFSYQSNDPGFVVFYELADVISVDYRYTCQGQPDYGSVTTWAGMGGGLLGCDRSHTDSPPEIADVQTIACPRA